MFKTWKVLGLLFAGIALFLSCSEEVTTSDVNTQPIELQEIEQQLEHAYQQGSQSALDEAFLMWQQTIPQYSSSEITAFPDSVRYVYDVFRAFYYPNDLDRITGGRHENFETNFRYIVAQNSLNYAVVDTNPQYYYYQGVTILERTIPDFRPRLNDTTFPVVYLSASVDSMIYRYLYQTDGTQEPDHQQRVTFLRQAMQLTHHHWISDYHKTTMPVVSKIYFNETFSEAFISFRVFYQFGEAYFERMNNIWVMIYSELTAIE